MLDVLITVSDSTPKNFVSQCRASVRAAVAQCAYPINVIEVPGVPGHIGQAMVDGLALGESPYVAWVDDDDFVLPNAFTCLDKHFAAQPPAICAREIHLLANGLLVPFHKRHHLTAWRREFIAAAPLHDHPAYPLVPAFRALGDSGVDEPSWVYVRRIRVSEGMKLRGQHGFGR